MPLTFYPHPEEAQKGTLFERIEVLMEAAERYKAVILDESPTAAQEKKEMTPREMSTAFNWDEIGAIFREVRELPEATSSDKNKKADLLAKLAEVYEVLRAARMPKLEAVRLALINEVNQLRSS